MNTIKKIIFLIIFCLFAKPVFAQKVGLALSGGGVLSLSQIGVLKVIDSCQIPLDYISGTSMGAVIGALYSIGFSAKEIEQIVISKDFLSLFRKITKRKDIFLGEKRWKPYNQWSFKQNPNFVPTLPQGLIDVSAIMTTFFDLTYNSFYTQDFNEFSTPFSCVATNIYTGEKKVFSSGNLPEALLASTCLPSVFSPVKIDSNYYIDGGLVNNLPAEEIPQDYFIIGVKSGSVLRSSLDNFVSVIDQTMTTITKKNVENSLKYCDLPIYSTQKKYTIMDFKNIQKLIDDGQKAALKHIDTLKKFSDEKKYLEKRTSVKKYPLKNKFAKIFIEGNKYVKDKTILSISGLKTNKEFSKKEILVAIKSLYDSQLFDLVYPKIIKDTLIITLKEKNRKILNISLKANNYSDPAISFVQEINNIFFDNSKFLLGADFGNDFQINLDYVKNIGVPWGGYLRFFPYYTKKSYDIYDEKDINKKISRFSLIEYGGLFGLGFYSKRAFIAESYLWSLFSKIEENIAELNISGDKTYSFTGLGIKIYHESLDDYIFPMDGTLLFLKYKNTMDFFGKNKYEYKELNIKFNKYFPIIENDFSFSFKIEYGNFFDSKAEYENYLIGGFDSYLGTNIKLVNVPAYKIYELKFIKKFFKNYYLSLVLANLELNEKDEVLDISSVDVSKSVALSFAWNNFICPLKIACAVNDDKDVYYYFSLGYDFDAFEFSRR